MNGEFEFFNCYFKFEQLLLGMNGNIYDLINMQAYLFRCDGRFSGFIQIISFSYIESFYFEFSFTAFDQY